MFFLERAVHETLSSAVLSVINILPTGTVLGEPHFTQRPAGVATQTLQRFYCTNSWTGSDRTRERNQSAGRHKSLASCAAFEDFSFRTCDADVCGVAVKEDRSVVVGERHLGSDSSLVLGELHAVNLLN